MLSAKNIALSFGATPALRGVDFELRSGECVTVVGPSGSGKSTLLFCLAGILTPDRGEVTWQGKPLSRLDDETRAAIRLRDFGIVLQFARLVPELSLLENVMLPLLLTGARRREAARRALHLLERLGVATHADRRPAQVSGGQAQRAAIARAVVHEPTVVFADEPTGALDRQTGDVALRMLFELVEESGSSLVMVTHDERLATRATRVIRLADGRADPTEP
ncbi:MAG: ABC transporter ATP-binding protein [Acidothermus sp.]|nr:ABC transporter ATP-binding protein [Acidothermus sp.]